MSLNLALEINLAHRAINLVPDTWNLEPGTFSKMYKNETYYFLKSFIPRRTQLAIRRQIVRRKLTKCRAIWPIDKKAAIAPEEWKGWPGENKFALILTHDVETGNGIKKCRQLAQIEQKLGFRSSFNFVGSDYDVPSDLQNYLTDNGFEIGVHGLHHDGNLFASKKTFLKHAPLINECLKNWHAVGFRAPSMYHDLDLIHYLDIDYDASTFDTDPFEPQPEGVGTIFPFWIPGNSEHGGYVELPYTLPQDFLLYILLKEKTNDIWKKKLEWIVEKGGMALFITHPDYMNFTNSKPKFDEYPSQYYENFLRHIMTEYKDQYWNVLPKDLASYWKKSEFGHSLFDTGRAATAIKLITSSQHAMKPSNHHRIHNIKIIDPENDSRWDEFVTNHKGGSLYHHSSWKRLIQKTYNYTPFYFIIENDRHQISAALSIFRVKSPFTGMRFVSLPFSDFSDPLVDNDRDAELLINAVISESIKHNATYVEFKTLNLSHTFDKFLSDNFIRLDYNRNHVLNLGAVNSKEDLQLNFHKNHIVRNIKKALKSNLRVHKAETEEDVKTFYRLEVKTRKKHGLPPQPYDFFKNMWEIFNAENMAVVLTAYEGSVPVASIFNIIFKNTMYYLYGGSDSKYLNNRPNHLLLWKSIEMAHQQGLEYFDFGRTSADHESLVDFKRNWGTNEMTIYHYRLVKGKEPSLLLNRDTNLIKKAISKHTHRLPGAIHKLIGRLIYKHMG